MQLPKLKLKSQLITTIYGFLLTFLFPVMILVCSHVLHCEGRKKETTKNTRDKTKALPRLQVFLSYTMHSLFEPSQHHTTLTQSSNILCIKAVKLKKRVLTSTWSERLVKYMCVAKRRAPSRGYHNSKHKRERKMTSLFSTGGKKENTLCIPTSSLIYVCRGGKGTEGYFQVTMTSFTIDFISLHSLSRVILRIHSVSQKRPGNKTEGSWDKAFLLFNLLLKSHSRTPLNTSLPGEAIKKFINPSKVWRKDENYETAVKKGVTLWQKSPLLCPAALQEPAGYLFSPKYQSCNSAAHKEPQSSLLTREGSGICMRAS